MSLAEYVDVAALVPYAQNARTHSADQIEQLKEAFRKFGFTGVLAYDDKGLAIGHGRRTALLEMWDAGEVVMGPGKREPLPEGQAPAIDITGLSDEERRALILADNKLALNAGWDDEMLAAELAALRDLDFDMPTIGFDASELDRLFAEPEQGGGGAGGAGGQLRAEFLIAPFTVLNAREGWWQDRKRQWIGLGIQSEVGRGDNLISRSLHDRLCLIVPGAYQAASDFIANCRAEGMDDDAIMAKAVDQYGDGGSKRKGNGRKAAAPMGQDLLKGEGKFDVGQTRAMTTQEWVKDTIGDDAGLSSGQSGTSIFDPVLTELAYRWFSPKGGVVLDPFAGGSVRGIVAAALGRRYVGIDLRPEQIEANQHQWPPIAAVLTAGDAATDVIDPEWHVGDSLNVLADLDVSADMIFSCPPYGDLEVYSDDPADISTMTAAEFDQTYAAIIAAAVDKLKPDRFACFVVGDYRDKKGIYANFVSKTIAAFEAAGMPLYNEAILITSVGSLPIRAAKQFRSTRKLGKTHQNVLVFVKGDPRKATAALGPVDVSAALADIEPDDD